MDHSIKKFDFFRGLSASLVVMAHAFQMFFYNMDAMLGMVGMGKKSRSDNK